MTTVSDPPIAITPEDLFELPDIGRWEALVCGQLKERNVSVESSYTAALINRRLGIAVEDDHPIGWVFQSDCGLQIFPWAPNQVRFADGGFYRRDRGPRPGNGHLRVAPDVVLEVVSHGDQVEDWEFKVDEYLRAGVAVVWVAFPRTRHVFVFRRSQAEVLRLGPEDMLDGGDAVPGFSARVSSLFLEPEESVEETAIAG